MLGFFERLVNLITYVSNVLAVVFEVLSLVHENRRQVVVSSTQSCCVRHLVRSSVHLKGLSVVRLWCATRQLHHRRAQWYACSVGCLSSSMLTVHAKSSTKSLSRSPNAPNVA